MAVTLERKFEQADANEKYALSEFNKWRSQYPDSYVGVVDGQLRYCDKNLDNLLARIRADRGGSTEGVLVLFIPDKQATIIV